jgi:hypothetical protein
VEGEYAVSAGEITTDKMTTVENITVGIVTHGIRAGRTATDGIIAGGINIEGIITDGITAGGIITVVITWLLLYRGEILMGRIITDVTESDCG